MKYLLSCFSCLLPLTFFSQISSAPIEQPIRQLFEAIETHNSGLLKSVFAPDAMLHTLTTDSTGRTSLRSSTLTDLDAALTIHTNPKWQERFRVMNILQDGPLATAWTDYRFLVNDELRYCGANAFTLVRIDESWKILTITDTRRTTNCRTESTDDVAAIQALMDDWHRAAATADEAVFFGSMHPDYGIYIGTDATERWTTKEMATWAAKYFERESAWSFTPLERNVQLNKAKTVGWFDEKLATWMGVCRASGVVEKDTAGSWKIAHYHLSVTIPNEKIEAFLKIVLPEAPDKK